MILALDIGASSFKWTLQDPDNPTDLTYKSQDFRELRPSPKNLFNDISDANSALAFSEIRICVPGPVKDGVLLRSLNLGWYNVDLVEQCRRFFRKKPSVVVSDVEATLACAQEELGQAKNLIALVLGTGLGVGVLIDGQRFSGKIHGHLSILGGKPCPCDRSDCLEGRVGWRGMVRAAQNLGVPARNGHELSQLASKGSHAAQSVLSETGELLGKACKIWIDGLQTPVKIWLGGGPSCDTFLRFGLAKALGEQPIIVSPKPRYAGLRGLLKLSI